MRRVSHPVRAAYVRTSLPSAQVFGTLADPSDIGDLETDVSADPLRDDPRYVDLLRRAGVETE